MDESHLRDSVRMETSEDRRIFEQRERKLAYMDGWQSRGSAAGRPAHALQMIPLATDWPWLTGYCVSWSSGSSRRCVTPINHKLTQYLCVRGSGSASNGTLLFALLLHCSPDSGCGWSIDRCSRPATRPYPRRAQQLGIRVTIACTIAGLCDQHKSRASWPTTKKTGLRHTDAVPPLSVNVTPCHDQSIRPDHHPKSRRHSQLLS